MMSSSRHYPKASRWSRIMVRLEQSSVMDLAETDTSLRRWLRPTRPLRPDISLHPPDERPHRRRRRDSRHRRLPPPWRTPQFQYLHTRTTQQQLARRASSVSRSRSTRQDTRHTRHGRYWSQHGKEVQSIRHEDTISQSKQITKPRTGGWC